jgi:hypothetical protein
MNRKTKITLTIIIVCGLFALVGFAVQRNINPDSSPNPSTSWPNEVDWATAIEILNSGQVAQVAQSHNLEVILTLKDGSQIKTVEPQIDDIFKEIDLCGETCSKILLITE